MVTPSHPTFGMVMGEPWTPPPLDPAWKDFWYEDLPEFEVPDLEVPYDVTQDT